VKLLFVKSNKIGSRLIRWTLKEDCSHFAVCFDDEANGSGIAFESIPSGAKLSWFGAFRRTHTLVHALSFKTPMPLRDEEDIYLGMLSQYSNQGYDFRALAFWIFAAIAWRVFGISLPNKNPWAVAGFNLCTGLAGGVKWIDQWAKASKIDLEMIGPQDLYSRLLRTGYFVDEADWCEVQNTPERG